MPDPRYRPIDFIADGKGFGMKNAPKWVDEPRDPDLLRQFEAARLQHQWVLRLRARLLAKKMLPSEYAERAGYSTDRLRRVMHGFVIARLEDIAASVRVAQVYFGPYGRQD